MTAGALVESAPVRSAPSAPVVFVCRSMERYRPLFDGVTLPEADAIAGMLEDGKGNEIWIIQTWLELRRRGWPVTLTDRFVPGTVCVAHYDDIALKEFPSDCFIVGVRADRPALPVAAVRIVQNPAGQHSRRDVFVPHWPQPGLIARDPARGTRVERVAYVGVPYNLHEAFRTEEFARSVRRLGMVFEVRAHDHHDYRDVDAVLAVRPGTRYDSDLKPASKLVNAWQAGCPALLGAESAYQHLRQSDRDYLEVTTPAEALAALGRLAADPVMYRQMVDNGLVRGQAFSREAVAQRWIDLLTGTVAQEFERWRDRPRWVRVTRFAGAAVAHKMARYIHQWRI